MRSDIAVITAALRDASSDPDLDQLSDALLQDARRQSARGAGRSAPAAARCEGITTDSAIALRRHVVASLDHTRSGMVVRSRAGDLRVGEADVAPLKALLTHRHG
jgi:hypothetical protein